MKTTRSPSLRETCTRAYARCGLEVIVAPRPGFAGKFALFSSRFGAIDTHWNDAEGKGVATPAGIAHFLEHQLFKKESGDLTDLFTANGAYSNAQTSHNATSFYFEAVRNLDENLGLLLNMCLLPYFRKDLVDVEREIICQEIASYRDRPNWVIYQSLLRALYAKHPVRIDIAGDQTSVGRITPAMLQRCHAQFYHPSNCILIVAGDVDPAAVVAKVDEQCQRLGADKPASAFERTQVAEPTQVHRPCIENTMHVATPQILVGYKDSAPPRLGPEFVRRDTTVGLAIDMLFGRGSQFFDQLYRDGVVSGDFSASYHCDTSFAYVAIGGETSDPAELERRIDARIAEVLHSGFDPDELERKKRKIYGRFLRNFESPESTAFVYHGAWLCGADAFTFPEVVERISTTSLARTISKVLTPHARAVSLLHRAATKRKRS